MRSTAEGYQPADHVASGSHRGGLLGQGSVLTLASPLPPRPNVPSLRQKAPNPARNSLARGDGSASGSTGLRELPRANGSHRVRDENFDAVGKWRDQDAGKPIDISSKLADGTVVDGVAGGKNLIPGNPERFAGAVTEKLLMYATGRNVQYFDAPAIRRIVREAAANDYKFSDLVLGITQSVPFQTRRIREDKNP